MTIELTPFDPAEYLTSTQSQNELLQEALESGDARYIANALGIIARAKSMEVVAKEAGLSRSAVYKALGKEGNPTLSTLISVLKPLGLKLSLETI